MGQTVGLPLVNWGWLYVFEVSALESEATVEVMEAGDTIGQPLRLVRNKLLECTINKLKLAHSGAVFVYK